MKKKSFKTFENCVGNWLKWMKSVKDPEKMSKNEWNGLEIWKKNVVNDQKFNKKFAKLGKKWRKLIKNHFKMLENGLKLT